MRTLLRLLYLLAFLAPIFFFSVAALAQEAQPAEEPTGDAPPKKKPASEDEPGDAESEEVKGDVGESCRRRADCAKGLKCVSGTCRDALEGTDCERRADCGTRLKCLEGICSSGKTATPAVPAANRGTWEDPGAAEPPQSAKGDDEGPSSKPFSGTRGFVGFMFTGGPSTAGGDVAGGLLFALKAGGLIDRTEIGIEFSPVTYVPDFDGRPTLLLQTYIGYHGELTPNVSWPIRFGVGLVVVNTNDLVLFQGRIDLVGISAMAGPVLFELYMPTFRIIPGPGGVLMSWMFGMGASIVP